MQKFNGHGSAMAQVYNHIIMPLANRRDKETQVVWGLADFEQRFGRKAEGMWLAETAVDTENTGGAGRERCKVYGIGAQASGQISKDRIREVGRWGQFEITLQVPASFR